ncbi:hypothetical protein MKEN_00323000 [Mycena kentingensis (nom. inval.)]|nr:hypothetical protein MKEN_00323000 [Mycena kentingensis (nom. inval.)]
MSYAQAASKYTPPNGAAPDPALLNTSPPSSSPGIDPTKKINIVPPTDDHIPRRNRHSRIDEAREEGNYLWQSTKHYILRPGVAGGLVGIVNLGLMGGAARAFWLDPSLRRDTRVISSVAGTRTARPPPARRRRRRAREEGALIYRHAKEQILRPGTLGGLVGLANVAILGTAGYFAYQNWDRSWDRRVVTAVSAGLATLSIGEGYLAEKYREQKKL